MGLIESIGRLLGFNPDGEEDTPDTVILTNVANGEKLSYRVGPVIEYEGLPGLIEEAKRLSGRTADIPLPTVRAMSKAHLEKTTGFPASAVAVLEIGEIWVSTENMAMAEFIGGDAQIFIDGEVVHEITHLLQFAELSNTGYFRTVEDGLAVEREAYKTQLDYLKQFATQYPNWDFTEEQYAEAFKEIDKRYRKHFEDITPYIKAAIRKGILPA